MRERERGERESEKILDTCILISTRGNSYFLHLGKYSQKWIGLSTTLHINYVYVILSTSQTFDINLDI